MKNVSVNLQHRLLLASKTKVIVAKSGAKIALIKTQQKQKHKRVDISVMTWGEIITKRYGNLPLAFSICLFDNIGNNDISSTIVKWFLITYPWWRHQMETFSTSLAICVGNSPVTGDSPHKGLCLQTYWYWWATEQLQHPKHIAIGSWLYVRSSLVQIMAWYHQATNHYLIQCWPRSMSSYDVTKPI